MSSFIVPHEQFSASEPRQWAFLVHGILGSRRNWRSFAQKLVRAHNGLGVVTLDLRNHGDSEPVAGPHTLAACASDLAALAQHLGIQPRVLIGHSFGGKVVLQRAADLPAGLEQVWVLDSRPDVMSAEEIAQSDVNQVIAALRTLPGEFDDRQDVVPRITELGFSKVLARWMTTNLQRTTRGTWTWRFHLDGVSEMIADYYVQDLSSILSTPVPDLAVHVVRAERSDRWPTEILSWFEHLPAGAPGRLHTLEDSGHWVHVDNPDGLLDLFEAEL